VSVRVKSTLDTMVAANTRSEVGDREPECQGSSR
jgi:hypothetical protein